MEHRKYMMLALSQARLAAEKGEVPVGTVIVKNGEVIAKAHNCTEKEKNPLCHSEIVALNNAVRSTGAKNLEGCTVYVTLEPCPMCMGALLNARVSGIVFGAYEKRSGAVVSAAQLGDIEFFRKPSILGGYMEKECRELLSGFFKKRRTDI